MKNKFYAVVIKYEDNPFWDSKTRKRMINASGYCYTWDKKHPEDTRKEKTVRVWAIYPRKKDAIADAKFRGCSIVKEVKIV